ncbi:MAG: hypothetical protein R2734_11645 [Nocardioides sp.]
MSADGDQPAFPTLSLTLSSTVDRVAEELRRAVFEGELESGTPLREVALADSLGVAAPPCARRSACSWPGASPPASPTAASGSPRPRVRHRRDRARTVLELAGVRAWPTASEDARAAVRQRSRVRRRGGGGRVVPAAQRAAPGHPPLLVALTESPRLVAMASR